MRPALSTALTTPRTIEPAGTSTRPFCVRSTAVTASKRCSGIAVSELNEFCRRTSGSWPAGITPNALGLASVGPDGAVVTGPELDGVYGGLLLVVLPHAAAIVAAANTAVQNNARIASSSAPGE